MWEEAAKAFAFEIGEVVKHKTGSFMVVFERFLHQCHGGIQRSYGCTAQRDVRDIRGTYNEMELEKYEENTDALFRVLKAQLVEDGDFETAAEVRTLDENRKKKTTG